MKPQKCPYYVREFMDWSTHMSAKNNKKLLAVTAAVAILAAAIFAQSPTPRTTSASGRKTANGVPGYTDTPLVPGQQWHVHDPARPNPPVVTPGAKPGDPPSDAIILFDGKDLSHWLPATQTMPTGVTIRPGPPTWKVEHGYMEIVPGSGDLATK